MKAVVLVLASLLARDASAHCYAEDNATHFELISSTGALVVEWGPRGLYNPLAKADLPDEDATAWKLTAGGTSFELTHKNIAPGLFVLVPTTAPSGKAEVTTPSGQTSTITFGADARPALLAAPRVTKLVRRVEKGMRGEKRTLGIATVKGDVPDDAIALVAYVGNKAVAWARPGQDEAGIEIFHDALPCWSQPNDAPAPRAGTKVSFAWLDRTGRLSKKSAAVAIK